MPDLLELDHLTVSGDVTFGKGGKWFRVLKIFYGDKIFLLSESAGHGDHHCQPRGPDRHPRRGRAGEQDRVRQPQDTRPLRKGGVM